MAGQSGQGTSQGTSQGKARPGHRRVAQWTRGYARLPGIPDEYLTEDGTPREVWTRFFDAFAELTPADIERRFGSADRHLREAGVSYRAPGETADRLWPLSHLPLLIDEAEWQQLTAGIVQRAQLLELVLNDLYGEGRLVAEGAVVSVHDPVAMPNAAAKRPGLVYAPSVSEAAEGADLLLHLTEWADYQAIDPAALAQAVARPVIIDARCCLDAELWSAAGWTVHVLGRP